MELEARREFYEKLYFHALSTRDSVESRLKLPLTVLGFVFAMLGYLFSKTVLGNQSVSIFYWLVFSSSCICLTVSIYFFIKAWHWYNYKALPIPDVLEDHLCNVRLKCEVAETEAEAGQAQHWTNEMFSEYLLDTFKEYASYNINLNDNRAYSLYRSVTAAIVAFVLGAVAYVPYYYAISINNVGGI